MGYKTIEAVLPGTYQQQLINSKIKERVEKVSKIVIKKSEPNNSHVTYASVVCNENKTSLNQMKNLNITTLY